MGRGFDYKSLDRERREIRLLELFPRSCRLSKIRPHCRVFTQSLYDNPPYLALSYVWGDANDTRIILVDKRPFKVTRNLYEALESNMEEEESLIVWIDAICINQVDDEEKGWQVGLMGNIYHQASRVIAWLGPAAGNSEFVMDFLQILGKYAEECGLQDGSESVTQIWRAIAASSSYMEDPNTIVRVHGLDGKTMKVTKQDLNTLFDSISGIKSENAVLPLADLKSLFLRPWWGRIWCLQEIARPSTAFFACGSKKIARRRFLAAFNAYYALWDTLRLRPTTPYLRQMNSIASHRVHVMLSMSRIYTDFSLAALLRATCVGNIHFLGEEGRQCLESTDPRDKIFALLGIAKDEEELKQLGLSPNYKISKRDVYVKTMIALLKQGRIEMLSFCRDSALPCYLPSWVPDWSQPMIETLQDTKPDHVTLFPKFNASKGTLPRVIVRLAKKKTTIKGIAVFGKIYGIVSRVGDVPRVAQSGTCIFPQDWLFEILRLSHTVRSIYDDYGERLRAVVRTSHAETSYGENGDLRRFGNERFTEALKIFASGLEYVQSPTVKVSPTVKMSLQSYLARKEVKCMLRDATNEPYRLHSRDYMRMTPGRSPFVTEKGNLGMSSSQVRRGDVVALIGGAQVPFILRPGIGRNYTIVSEAYVDGIMDGEAAEAEGWTMIDLV